MSLGLASVYSKLVSPLVMTSYFTKTIQNHILDITIHDHMLFFACLVPAMRVCVGVCSFFSPSICAVVWLRWVKRANWLV